MTHSAHAHDHRHDLDGQATILDLDAQLLAAHTASIIDWLPLRTSPCQVVDLGCGTGAGTFALLAHFPEAHVTAVDVAVEHLHRLREKAGRNGVADQVRTVHADLDTAWPDLGEPDLVWASAALHHMADPDRILRRVHDTLVPGGLFALVELAGFPRFLPEDAPADRPGLEERLHAVGNRRHAEQLRHRGTDWGPRLTAAGFTREAERTIAVNIDRSHSETVARYALESLRRMREVVAEELPAGDLAALDRMLDTDGPHSILRRDDLAVRTERTVWAARRA